MKADKTLTKVPSKYADFINIFSPKLAMKLLEYIGINNHAIKLINNQQTFYSPIYSLDLAELETLKIYIKNNLANSFIRPFKSLVKALILFYKKLDKSL